MFKYLFNYIILLLIFIAVDFFLTVSQSVANLLGYLPTLTMVGNTHILLVIPYSYLIVRFIFIRKANKLNESDFYASIKKKLRLIITIINIIFLIIETLFFNNQLIWIIYSISIVVFLIILKTEKEKRENLMKKNIKTYFGENKKR
jgi:hypothetical protein